MREIDAINDRLQKGDERFAEVTEALSRITTHLRSQDATMANVVDKLDKVVEGTDSIVTMWNGGVTAVRLFCRLAEAWKFMFRQVVVQVGAPGIVLYSIWHYAHYHTFPIWICDVYKLLVATL
jgi:hypothetical protein